MNDTSTQVIREPTLRPLERIVVLFLLNKRYAPGFTVSELCKELGCGRRSLERAVSRLESMYVIDRHMHWPCRVVAIEDVSKWRLRHP